MSRGLGGGGRSRESGLPGYRANHGRILASERSHPIRSCAMGRNNCFHVHPLLPASDERWHVTGETMRWLRLGYPPPLGPRLDRGVLCHFDKIDDKR